jgi:tRNA A37 threonylcarbamoyladenosine biosynthesis protein TsaE
VDLALDELEDGRCVLIVEWGDAIEELLPDDLLQIQMTVNDVPGEDETRTIAIRPRGSSWDERSDELMAAVRPWSQP